MDASESDQENVQQSSASLSEQRKLTYRHLLNRVEGIQESEEVGLQTVKTIGDILKEVNSLEEECAIDTRFEQADETLLDSIVLSSASSVLIKCIEAIDVFTCTYESAEFANKINNFISEGNEEELDPQNLLKLSDDARAIIPDVPVFSYVYGTYDLNKVPEPKQKKERIREPKEKLQKKEPEKVVNVEKEEASIDEIVKMLHSVLVNEYSRNNEQPVKYYDYVIDTDSFSNTVENMFYCSFLIRDGKAEIDLNSQGEAFIRPMRKSQLKQMRDSGGSNAQIITAIRIEDWEKFSKQGMLQRYRKTKHPD